MNGTQEVVRCPDCGSTRSKVTTVWRAGRIKRRRRECLECGRRFDTSQEVPPENVDLKGGNCHNGKNPHCHVKKD
jgi:transcription elongation factor Elf1